MKILIIGGTGLISTYITQKLADQHQQVTLFNRGLSSYPTPAGVSVLHGDRTDYAAFENQVRAAGRFDAVIDMVGFAPQDAESLVQVFSGQTAHLIFCSTVDVYAKPARVYPYTEAEIYGGLNDYARNKIIIEKRLIQTSRAGAFPLTIIRPAYTYGEGRGPLHTFGGSTTYVDRIRRGLPVVVHGDGSSIWVSCHASDVAGAFANALSNPPTYDRAYHTAGEEWMTWNTYHQQVAQAIGAPPPQLVHIPTDALARIAPRQAGLALTNIQYNNFFDNSAAHRELDFQYTIDWQTGVRRMVAWLDEHHAVNPAESEPFDERLISLWQSQISAAAAEFSQKDGSDA